MARPEPETAKLYWASQAQYLMRMSIEPGRARDWDAYPFNLPFAKRFRLEFSSPITFLVGENGSGKSTIIEAIADLCRLPVTGGGPSEFDSSPTSTAPRSPFARAVSAAFRHRPHDGYFVRAENIVRLADLLDERERDPDFYGSAYFSYGGRSLHERSHGEAFLALFEHRLQTGGVIIMDEPESALSPQRQLALLAMLWQFVQAGNTQVIIATHSPILMTFPGAVLLHVSESGIEPTKLEDTSHYQITRGILANPEQYWKHLRSEMPSSSDKADEP
jgi:predicted ATPase